MVVRNKRWESPRLQVFHLWKSLEQDLVFYGIRRKSKGDKLKKASGNAENKESSLREAGRLDNFSTPLLRDSLALLLV